MYGEFSYAAAYIHLFYVLCCVERYVDCSRVVLCGEVCRLQSCCVVWRGMSTADSNFN
jgi:hypothetical protein